MRVEDAAQSLALIQAVFAGEKNVARDMIALNAGAALYVCGQAADIAAGVQKALAAIDSGAAGNKLTALAALTQSMESDG